MITNVAFGRPSTTYTPTEYLKNYALSACIADGFKSKEVVYDSAAAARAYVEFGDFPLEAYTEAAVLGKKFLTRKYNSQTGEKLILMKCIDFYHSKELDQIAKKYNMTPQ